MAQRICRGTTKSGLPCRNQVAAGRDTCGRCQGVRPAAHAVQANGTTLKSALSRLRDQQIEADQVDVSNSTSDGLEDQPTPMLVRELRDRTAGAIAAQARMFAIGDANTIAHTAASDQATAARREASRYEDAIKHRHPDPYGAALVTSAWESAGGVQSEPTRIRRWMADNPQAPAADIHAALNKVAEHDIGVDRLRDVPWVHHLNRAAAVRASHLNNPGSVTDHDLHATEAQWQQVQPQPVR